MWYTKRNTYLTEEIKHIQYSKVPELSWHNKVLFHIQVKNHYCKRQNVDVTHGNSEII